MDTTDSAYGDKLIRLARTFLERINGALPEK